MLDFLNRDKNTTNTLSIYKSIFKSENCAMLIISSMGDLIDTNEELDNLLKIKKVLLPVKKLFHLVNGDAYNLNELLKIFQNRKDTGTFSVESKYIFEEDELPLNLIFSHITTDDKSQSLICIKFENMTQELFLKSLKYHDQLTGLPNQQQAFLDISIYINRSQFGDHKFAILLLAIDDLVKLRSNFGHSKMNNLVIVIAKNLQFLAQELDVTVYQVTCHGYLLLLPDVSTEEEIETIHCKITADLSKILNEVDFMNPTFSIGATLFPQGGGGAETLLDNVYNALNEANKRGSGKMILNRGTLVDSEMTDELELLNNMKFGLENNQFLLHYQPLIDMNTGKITGAEALVRWNHPKLGFIPPLSFIPLAKKSGFIIQLGKFIIKQAIKQQKQWEVFDFNNIEISIKVTLREIETEGFVKYIEDQLIEYDIKQELIRFEIPENVAMISTGVAKREFESLKRLGVSLSLDNFGTGLSSLAYLRELPLDMLKIDYSFILDIVGNKEHQKIVKAMIDLGHNFDLNIVASGIEKPEIYDLLKSYGCDMAQGYYLSEPLPTFEFQEILRHDVDMMSSIRTKKRKATQKDDYYDLYSEKLKNSPRKRDKIDYYRLR